MTLSVLLPLIAWALVQGYRALRLATLRLTRSDVIELTGRVEELELREKQSRELIRRITTAESAANAREAKAAKASSAAAIEQEARDIMEHAARQANGPASELSNKPRSREELKAELRRKYADQLKGA